MTDYQAHAQTTAAAGRRETASIRATVSFTEYYVRQGASELTKTDLVRLLATETNQSQSNVGDVVSSLLRVIMETVAAGQPVLIPGFGTFKPAARAARQGKNPATGAVLEIPATIVPRFTAGATFRNLVREGAELED